MPLPTTPSRPSAHANPRPSGTRPAAAAARQARHGRALVELIVAALLLSIASTACLAMLQTAVASADAAVQINAARDVSRTVGESLHANACAATAGATTRERTTATWSRSANGPLVQQAVTLTRRPELLGARGVRSGRSTPPSLSTIIAGWCT